MIATIGLPGSSSFRYKRVRTRSEANAWRRAWLAKVGESQETLNAVRQGLLLSDRVALRERYQSGEHVYGFRNSAGRWTLPAYVEEP